MPFDLLERSMESPTYDHSYSEWKKWEHYFQFDDTLDRYFRGELKDVPIAGSRVLEVGFGAGRFLAWAAAHGATVTGCEIISGAVERGRAMGYDVRCGDPRLVVDPVTERFDIIAAFDVLEHVPGNDLVPLLQFLAGILQNNGTLIARMPNGESPFGRFFQHGDLTHVSTLSVGKFRQIAPLVGLSLCRYANQFRVVDPNSGWWGWRDPIRFFLRDFIERFVCFVYGFSRRPLDPNVVVFMKHRIE